MIRRVAGQDLASLTEIYNQAIRSGRCTADTIPFTPAGRSDWLAKNENDRTPIYVYETAGSAVGYCYLSPYRPGRPALAGVAEISYYVDFAHHRRGIGRSLVAHTIAQARVLGYDHLVAILLGCNTASIALLKSFGFREWGCLPEVACIGGERFSHVYYGLDLRTKTSDPAPAKPGRDW